MRATSEKYDKIDRGQTSQLFGEGHQIGRERNGQLTWPAFGCSRYGMIGGDESSSPGGATFREQDWMDDKFNIKFGKRGEHLGAFGYCSLEGMGQGQQGPFEQGNLSNDICGGGIVDSGVVEPSTGGFSHDGWSKSTMEVWYNSSTEPFTNMNSDDYSETCSLDGSPCLDINGETWNGDETLCPPECG